MKIVTRWNNGIVFGIAHQSYIDLDEAEGETFEERMEDAPEKPMIFVYFGPLIFIFVW